MFAFLRGIVAHKGPTTVSLDVHGVGFGVVVPDGVHRRLLQGAEITLLTYCHIREDAFTIFGFLREEEKRVFEMLLGVSGIGPKLALAVATADRGLGVLAEHRGGRHVPAGLAEHGVVEDDRGDALAARGRVQDLLQSLRDHVAVALHREDDSLGPDYPRQDTEA